MTAAQAAKPLLHVEVILGNVPGNFVRADVVSTCQNHTGLCSLGNV